MSIDVTKLFSELGSLSQVEAIALGGSRATGRNDEKSDYDVYVYITNRIDENVRRNILDQYCGYMEIGNSFWELEDDVTLKDGIDMDIIYRNMDDFEKMVSSVVIDCVSSNGYTTCMWHNLITSKIVLDKNGKLNELQKKYQVKYPEKLKKNIVSNNLKLLSGMLPSFDMQIKKAENRGDLVSVNHRVTEFLASYFDIIFALNEMTHPGEKRMQSICAAECKILPNGFHENLNRLFAEMFRENISAVISDMVFELQKVAKMQQNPICRNLAVDIPPKGITDESVALLEKQPDYLVLVNEENRLPEGFAGTVELITVENALGEPIQVEKRTYEAFLRLQKDLLDNDGIQAGLSNSYRTVEKQEEIYTRYTREFGPEYAAKYAAKPGHSEHHTGLAIDVGLWVNGKFHRTIEDLLSVDDLFQVVQQKLPRYGFLLRYPRGKESVTKIGYEPWHYRYIDSPALATELTKQNLSLEEYHAGCAMHLRSNP